MFRSRVFAVICIVLVITAVGLGRWWLNRVAAENQLIASQQRDEWIANTISSIEQGQSSVLLYCCVNTDLMLERISGMPQVRRITFEQTQDLSDAGLTYLTSLPNLDELDFRGERGITDSNIAILAGCSKLRSLGLKHCRFVTDAGIDEVGKMTQLRTFKHDGQFSEAALKEFQTMAPECTIEVAGWYD